MASKYCKRVKSCKHSWWCADNYSPKKTNYECFIQLTNADRIRAMSDEELAEWISNRAACSVLCPRTCSSGFEDCKPAWLDWLKSPAEECIDGN